MEDKFESSFKKIFPPNNIFLKPNQFDAHYSEYFDFFKYFEKENKFEYYEDKCRETLLEDLCTQKSFVNYLTFLYGKSGMGKSITLIRAFKYNYDLNIYGVLYINCKYMFKTFRTDIKKVKIILIDEIPYLFSNEYCVYEECKNQINNYYKSDLSTFWDLIKIIINYCVNENKYYFFIFDQYKEKLDVHENLFLINNYLKDKNKFALIACCTMNNKDVCAIKIDNIFGSESLKKKQII